jgi:hypothetical protein
MTNYDPEDKIDSDSDEDPVQKTLELLFDKGTISTKKGHMHQISRFCNNILSFMSPVTKQLHMYICQNRSMIAPNYPLIGLFSGDLTQPPLWAA